jgi:hypothetical protein
MAYIGRSVEYGNAASQQITGNNGATYTLTYDTTTDGVIISLDGVVQVNGTDFSIVGTALTFTSNVTTGVKVNVIYTGLTVAIGVPGDSTITSAKVDPAFLTTLTAQASPEVYGFSVNATGNLIVTTTNAGVDTISSATFGTFDDAVFAVAGFTWSLVGTQLRCTI